jgi:hypothetical protein
MMQGLVKKTAAIDSSQKAALNRKGNILFNSGQVEAARRVYLTTGYSDGLVRVGETYEKRSEFAEALKMYKAAHDNKHYASVIERMAAAVQAMMHQDDE